MKRKMITIYGMLFKAPFYTLCVDYLTYYLQHGTCEAGIITPFLQIRKLRHREIDYFAQGHTTRRWQSLDLNFRLPSFKAVFILTTYYPPYLKG